MRYSSGVSPLVERWRRSVLYGLPSIIDMMCSGDDNDLRAVTAGSKVCVGSSAGVGAAMPDNCATAACIEMKNAGTSSALVRVFGFASHAAVSSAASSTALISSLIKISFFRRGRAQVDAIQTIFNGQGAVDPLLIANNDALKAFRLSDDT